MVALVYVLLLLIGKREYTMAIFVFLTTAFTITHFVCFAHYWVTGYVPDHFIAKLHDVMTSTIFPLLYICISLRLGIKRITLMGVLLFLLVMLNFLGKLDLNLDGTPITDSFGHNFELNIYYGGKQIFGVWYYEFIMFIQSLMMVIWLINLRMLIKRRSLSINPLIKESYLLIFIACIIIIHEFLAPHSIWENYFSVFIYDAIFSVILTFVLISISYSYNNMPVIDSHREPTMIEGEIDTRGLYTEISHLMDAKRIFLNPDLQVEDVASMLGSNRTYINNVIYKVHGISFEEILINRRIEEAKSLLRRDRNLRLDEITEQTGFKSSLALTKSFRDVTGSTPGTWIRRQHSI